MADGARLEVALRHRIGGVTLAMEFTLSQLWTVLFAPSGAGKSTVLRIIAGLVRPDVARVEWIWPVASGPERTIVLTDTTAGVFVPPHRRMIRFVGQQTALFPHRTVLGNVTYGMIRPFREDDDRNVYAEQVNDLLRLCRIEHLAGTMPAMLSGGERQRVAIARAIGATGSRMLLLDEPFSGLHTAMREELLGDLKPWLAQRGIPVLQVTHDVGEVFALGAEVVKMGNGRVIAQGPAAEVLREEQRWLAEMLRMNRAKDEEVAGRPATKAFGTQV